MLKAQTGLFSYPVYTFVFPRHEELKPVMMEYLDDESVYEENTKRDTLKFTTPNLNKIRQFQPLAEFIEKCLTQYVIDLGFLPQFQITSMWATSQRRGGWHHRHTHGNSYVAGAYYLHSTDAEKSAGTRFYNPQHMNVIVPPLDKTRPRLMASEHVMPFVEGEMSVFPAWLPHDTPHNKADLRRIVGFNAMPMGVTNSDTFDRFHYQQQDPIVFDVDTVGKTS